MLLIVKLVNIVTANELFFNHLSDLALQLAYLHGFVTGRFKQSPCYKFKSQPGRADEIPKKAETGVHVCLNIFPPNHLYVCPAMFVFWRLKSKFPRTIVETGN